VELVLVVMITLRMLLVRAAKGTVALVVLVGQVLALQAVAAVAVNPTTALEANALVVAAAEVVVVTLMLVVVLAVRLLQVLTTGLVAPLQTHTLRQRIRTTTRVA
jgi:hypothetical protein